MALYQYIKAPPQAVRTRKTRRKGLSFLLMGLGAAILIWVFWPILSFTAMSDTLFAKIVTPVADSQKTSAMNELSPVAYAASDPTAVDPKNVDFTNVNLWYPTAPQKHVAAAVNTYLLTIPKLQIHNAQVTVASDDLNDTLVHYGGTALPGQYGTAVIFGHSTLPQFYSPTNYKTIFSFLPSLKEGDEIDISYDGVNYTYTINEMDVLDPTDLSVLDQHFDDSYLTLVTCVPPGTTWKRLAVRAKLKT